MPSLTREEFVALIARERTGVSARGGGAAPIVAPIGIRLLSDQLTPVLAYRRLVARDERTAPSFLLESVEGGERQGRYSLLGAQPAIEVIARGHDVRIIDRRAGREMTAREDDPLQVMKRLMHGVKFVRGEGMGKPAPSSGHTHATRGAEGGAAGAGIVGGLLPRCAAGGWYGYAGYDTVRYAEPEKLDGARAPRDDRGLADLHFGFYDRVVVFDHVAKLAHLVRLARVEAGEDAGAAYDAARADLDDFARRVQTHSKPLASGLIERAMLVRGVGRSALSSNMTREQHGAMVARAKEYIGAGDIFQVVLGQRFERTSAADPFDVYRALRAVNPSPYMVYMQCEGCILVASSPEILCRVRRGSDGGTPPDSRRSDEGGEGTGSESRSTGTGFVVTNRPLAGTRRRGATPEEDAALERELLADEKERAEHVMLVDLGRNDLGRVCEARSIELPAVMEIERYSHVMHISSTVTGVLRDGLDCWDALRATLPVGTISGAPKIRAMQIIDELEPVRRGPYGGGMGSVSMDGEMDIALALRTIVVPTAMHAGGKWTYHIQAAGGIVADSEAEAEYMETVNKAAALAQAVEVAERAFGAGGGGGGGGA